MNNEERAKWRWGERGREREMEQTVHLDREISRTVVVMSASMKVGDVGTSKKKRTFKLCLITITIVGKMIIFKDKYAAY